ncbi:hypothetical protein ACLKA6_011046 [Drosophila palustris]
MQNIIKGFLITFGCGTAKASPVAAPAAIAAPKTAAKSPKESKKPVEDDVIIDMDKCFEVGYLSVKRATTELMQTMHQKKPPVHSFDMYTRWNTRIEDMLVNDISEHYPKHKFITRNKHRKQVEAILTDDPTWFIDPIHGTINFMHGFPYAVVNLAFWVAKQPRFGIIWNPLLDQCYTARSGFGAYMNVNRLRVSKHTELSDALVMHEFCTNTILSPDRLRYIRKIANNAHGLRSLGCTSLNMCLVAQGFADAYFDFSCSSWDMSAATLMVKEAGGVVLDPSLQPFDIMSRRVLCASTQELAEELSLLLHANEPKTKCNDTKKKVSDMPKKEPEARYSNKNDKEPSESRNDTTKIDKPSVEQIKYHKEDAMMVRRVLSAYTHKLAEDLASPYNLPSKPIGGSSEETLRVDETLEEITADMTKNFNFKRPKNELANDPTLRNHPPFSSSMKFSGHPKQITKTKRKSVSRYPTDPNFPGQGSYF